MDITREDIRRELDLEAEAQGLGAARYERSRPLPWRRHDETPGVEEEANLPPGKHLIRAAIEPTAEAIKSFIARANDGKAGRRHSAVKWLEMASPEEVAYLTLRVAVNEAPLGLLVQTVAIRLGRAIIDHVEMLNFKRKNKAGYVGLIRSQSKKARGSRNRQAAIRKMLANEDSREAITAAEKLHLGMAALELMVDATGLFTIEWSPRVRGAYEIRPVEAVRKWLSEQHARSSFLDPILMPMVVRPRRWRNPRTGGYLNRLHGQRLIKNEDREYQGSLFHTDLSLVYDAVNHIQETPWRINKAVLAVMREVWDGGGLLGGLPPREDLPLPPKPHDIETNEEALKTWKRDAAITYEENARLYSKRLAVQQRLWMAEKFVEEAAIWFPHSLDFRGRIYPMPTTELHPQGSDASKALLEFAHGLPMGPTGGYWLAVHIANLFGVDKVSFKDRVEWTYAHSAELIDSALNPLDGDRFWTTADDPWMALAAAIDFAGFLSEGEGYVSHLPIPLDGSNSGLQHFSAMLRDPVGAAAVNLTVSDHPQDVYDAVGRRAQAVVDQEPTITYTVGHGEEAREVTIENPWRNGKVTRKIAKRPTMTFVYSATRFGMQEMILETLRDLDAEHGEPYLGGADNYHASVYLSHILFEAVSGVVKAASGAMGWLRSVAKVASDAQAPIRWTAPDGLPILQAYRETLGNAVEVHWQGKRMTVMLRYDGSRLSPRSQANGLAPNFVHSLDGAHLRAVARAAKAAGIDYLAVIHDSFATHAANTDRLVGILRETFVAQYEPDVLSRFRQEIVDQLPEEWKDSVPPVPQPGTLDLQEVRASAYLFS